MRTGPMDGINHQAAFTVGEWAVIPSLDRLERGDDTVVVEPRVMEVLVHLARHPGEVISADELIAEVWKGTIVSDAPVYHNVAKLRKALGDDPKHPAYVETVPKRGYRLIAKAVFPETAAETAAVVEQRTGWRTTYVIPALSLLLSSLFFFVSTSDMARTGPTLIGSIAVLPFADMSGDGSQEYFGDGIAEELLHTLSNLPDMRVVARTSSFSFKDKDLDIPTIGEKLNVEAILEGSVRRSGDRIRITAQLVRADSGYHIWSQRYDRDVGDIFEIQDEIATMVAQSLRPDFTSQIPTRNTTDNTEAYEQYLLGKHQMHQRQPETLKKAIGYFQRAVELDPYYALAYADMSFAYFLASDERYGPVPEEEALLGAEESALRAMDLNDQLPEAWHALSAVRYMQGDDAEELRATLRMVELNPNSAIAQRQLSEYYREQGQHEEAIQAMEKAVRLDPLSAVYRVNLSRYLWFYNRLAEAEEELTIAAEINPNWHATYFNRVWMSNWSGRPDEAILWARKALAVEGPQARWAPQIEGNVTYAYLTLGDYKEAERRWEEAGEPDDWESANPRIHLLLAQGRFDAAHTLLDEYATDEQEYPNVFSLGGLYEMVMGHDEHAAEYFDRALRLPHETIFDPDVSNLFVHDFLRWGALPALNRAHLYLKSGDGQASAALLTECEHYLDAVEQLVPDLPSARYVRASMQAIQGNKEEALSLFREALDMGWVRPWYVELDPNMDSIHDGPEFQAILKDMNARVAEMRERVRLADAATDL